MRKVILPLIFNYLKAYFLRENKKDKIIVYYPYPMSSDEVKYLLINLKKELSFYNHFFSFEYSGNKNVYPSGPIPIKHESRNNLLDKDFVGKCLRDIEKIIKDGF